MSIYEQLTDYCNCVEEKGKSTKNIDELIHVISTATCWARDNACETFLNSERMEVLDLPTCPDKCFVFEYKPFYHPYIVETFEFQIVEIDGIHEEPIGVPEYEYSYIDEMFRIKLPLDDCTCRCICGCEKSYKLVVKYEAGYEEIPECLLPVMCEMLDLIGRKNDCDCECETCNTNPNIENNTDYGQYSKGDALTFAIVNDIGNLITKQYKKQLGMISLCRDVDEFWGFSV